ncbi:helix-turn-helix domain-containing protein [Paucilactobacillus suebicus]|uniref:Transcriptional regulator n=1 Tax=Paucilactobacillus suebicus DSM 5007 = KCTC 3549 TaxID=1423807 RepID=A0A0R1W1V6_9LACO|nr:TetR/AcrR family transcriptional regulator [Paucilactobacillus suebicus]KRM11848.1 transcriptional regulator [Paucilactobacillus suebicus DSM 5007 = KCTC 3549]
MTKSEQQRENILAVAREMFASKGFEATTTRELNNRLDIADGLLYYYFPHGKKQILDTIIKQGIQTRVNSIDVAFSDVTDASALTRKLVSVFDNMWDLFADQGSAVDQ